MKPGHPDFPAVEKHFGRPLPTCVRSLYADREELLRGGWTYFEVRAWESSYGGTFEEAVAFMNTHQLVGRNKHA